MSKSPSVCVQQLLLRHQSGGKAADHTPTTAGPFGLDQSSSPGQVPLHLAASSPPLWRNKSSRAERGVDSPAVPGSQFGFVRPGAYFVTEGYLGDELSLHFYMKTVQKNCRLLSVFPWDERFSSLPFASLTFQVREGYLELKIHFRSPRRQVHGSSRETAEVETMRVPSKRPITDGRWHLVRFSRLPGDAFEMRLDDLSRSEIFSSFERTREKTKVKVNVGGGPGNGDHGQINPGLVGCMAGLVIGGDLVDPKASFIKVPEEFKGFIRDGCQEKEKEEKEEEEKEEEEEEEEERQGEGHEGGKGGPCPACQNGGVCQERYGEAICNCQFTSHTGSTCNIESTSFAFGQPGGLVSLTFYDWQRTDEKKDHLSFIVRTNLSDSIVVKISSSNPDEYLQVEVMDGNVFVVYNMGSVDHVVGDLSGKVDDGEPHAIRVLRAGPNVSLQIDHWPPVLKAPSGRQRSVFNQISEIMVGAKKDSMGSLVRPFEGVVSAVVYNGLEVLEEAVDDDPRVVVTGHAVVHTRSKQPETTTTRRFSSKILQSSGHESGPSNHSIPRGKCQQEANCNSEEPNGNRTIKSSHLCNSNKECNQDIPAGDSIHSNGSTDRRPPQVPSDGPTVVPPSSHPVPPTTAPPRPADNARSSNRTEEEEKRVESTRRLALVMIVVAISGSLVGILVLVGFGVYATQRYRTRNEGSYKIDSARNYGGYEVCSLKSSNSLKQDCKAVNGRSKTVAAKERKRNQEWYV